MNTNVPLWAPRFRQNPETFDLEYKPFPRYPTWLVAWEMSWLVDVFSSYDALFAGIADQFIAVNDAMILLAADIATAQATADAALAGAGDVGYPSIYYLNPRHLKSVVSQFNAFAVATTDAFNGLYVLTGLNSEVTWKLPTNAENILVWMLVTKYAGAGDVSLYIDGNLISATSFYSAVTVRNFEHVFAPAALAKGLHTFNLKITGKQPSSSGYNVACNYIVVCEQ